MLSRDVMQLENQRFFVSNSVQTSRQMNNKSQGSDVVVSSVQQSNNPGQGILGQAPTSAVQSSVTQNNSSVYNGFYNSSAFNSINNFEASLQWLTENRIPNNSLLSDKNLNCSSTPSHSCCVNRLGGVDNLGMCSPMSGDSYRSNRDTVNYQTKPPALSVNVIDSVQNWFNLPPLPNQQYNGKFNDQNMNCSQLTLPLIEQGDLKQNDICLQITDSYFEPTFNNNLNKQLSSNGINELTNNEQSAAKNYSSYQTNIMSRDTWKQPLQTAASYISSPTLFNTLTDSPEHYLFTLPPPSSTGSYCMISDNTNSFNTNKLPLSTCSELQQNSDKHQSFSNTRYYQTVQNRNDKTLQLDHRIMNENTKINQAVDVSNTLHNACTIGNSLKTNSDSNNRKFDERSHYSLVYLMENTNAIQNNDNALTKQNLGNVSKDTGNNVIEIADETTSDSEESNIIVEESDMEEIDSVISIDEMKKVYMTEEPVELRCLVCNLKSSTQTPATQFIHMNDSFPLTSASKMPVAAKLIQILPTDLQHFLKLNNSFMCRRCLNLIETVEVLEVKLTSVKQTLSENFSKTVQYFLPATPTVEIENGTAKIINKEIIPHITNSSETDSSFVNDLNPSKMQMEHLESNEMEESEGEAYDKDDDDEELQSENEVDDIIINDDCVENSENSSKENEENGTSLEKQCNICTKVLSSVKNYKKHMQLHTKCFSFYCEYCGKGFNFKKSLDRHIKLHSKDSIYQCEKCGKTYTQKHRLDGHLRRHSGELKISCDECGKGFTEKAVLKQHIKTHTKEQPCICEICGAKFSKMSNLKAHLQLCNKKEEIKCNFCTEVFYSKTHLKKHEMTNHGVNPTVECNVCGKAFVNVKDLKPHMRSHLEEKPFECKLCGKRYKSTSNLNQHAKIHDVSKLLKCSLCGEVFSRKKLLEDHMNKHAGVRVYKCTECSKEFFEQRHLQRHMKIHSGTIKMKTCNVCGKQFRNGLKVHMRTHTGVKPYVCNYCGLAFTVNSVLTRHVQSKHQNVYES